MKELKKGNMLIVFILIFLCTAVSGSPAYSLETRAGLSAGWLETFYFYDEKGTDNFVHEHFDSVEATALVDWRYLRLGIGYSRHVLSYIVDNTQEEKKFGDYNISFLNFSATAKYSFSFFEGKLLLWPGIGLEYDYNLTYKKNGADLSGRYNELNDLYLTAGAGIDYAVLDGVWLTAMLLAGWNVTPRVGDHADVGHNFSGMNIRAHLGFLMRIL